MLIRWKSFAHDGPCACSGNACWKAGGAACWNDWKAGGGRPAWKASNSGSRRPAFGSAERKPCAGPCRPIKRSCWSVRSTWVCCLNCCSELEGPQAASDMVVAVGVSISSKSSKYVQRLKAGKGWKRLCTVVGMREDAVYGHMSPSTPPTRHSMADRGCGKKEMTQPSAISDTRSR